MLPGTCFIVVAVSLLDCEAILRPSPAIDMSMAPPQQQNLRIIAQRSLGKIQEYPKWLVFQLASIIIVTFFVVVALICFLAAWKPSHDARSEVRLSESTNSTASRLVRPLLKGNINQTSIQVSQIYEMVCTLAHAERQFKTTRICRSTFLLLHGSLQTQTHISCRASISCHHDYLTLLTAMCLHS